MKTSDSIGKIAAALSAVQGAIRNPTKDKKANIKSDKGSFSYTYADFATALDAIRPVLAEHKIAVVQATSVVERFVMLETRLIHESGEWVGNDYPVGPLADHRTMGSALSYARRYSIFPMLGVQGEDDDDGEADQQRPHDRAPHIKSPPPKLSVHAEREHSVPDTADISGTKGVPKNEAAKKLYETLIVQMRQAQSIEGLKTWLKLCRTEIETLPDEYMAYFDEAYENHRDSLTARAA